MKKFISLFAATMLLCTALSSCGDVSQSSSDAGATTAPAASESSDLAAVKASGKLIIGMTEFAPMNYKASDGSWTGFETEFAQAVCEKLGVEAEFQVINWDSKIVELNGKTIDCIWNGMTITDEIKENADVSTPYLENRQVIVCKDENKDKFTSRDGNPDLSGLTIVAEKGSAGETTVTKSQKELFSAASYTPVDSQATALLEVSSGTADAAVVDYVMSIGSIGEGTDNASLVAVINSNFEGEQYGIAFRKGSDLTAEVNRIITELVNSGKLSEIAAKYKLNDLLIAK